MNFFFNGDFNTMKAITYKTYIFAIEKSKFKLRRNDFLIVSPEKY